LLIDRRKVIKSAEGDDSLVSGTGTFIAVNLMLVVSTVFILVGTTLPVFTSIIPDKTYFNIVNLPFFLSIILLAGLCILIGWNKPDLKKLNKQLLWSAAGALLVVIALIIAGLTQWYTLVPFSILAAVFIATVVQWGQEVAARMRGKKVSILPAFGGLFMANRSRHGGYIIHLAIVVLALGIIGSSAYKNQVEQTLNVGDSVTLKGYTLTYNGFDASTTQKSDTVVWLTVVANIDVTRSGKTAGAIHPTQILQFAYSGENITDMGPISNKVAIRSNPAEDLYVIFEDFDGTTQQALVLVLVNPLVQWIWIGGFLLLVGGLVSFSATPRRITASEDTA
jgi:cytochrome c-type biogenesis protein CcmF